jgi:predicted aspartyl protease
MVVGLTSALRRIVLVAALLVPGYALAQVKASASSDEIPIERCDLLPVVQVKAAGHDMRFLLDTGATTLLNLKAFSAGTAQRIRVDSW